MGHHSVDSNDDAESTVLSDKLSSLNFTEKTSGEADALDLPPLPLIRSREIRSEVFMHRSVLARPSALFADPPDDLYPDNERLEHLGDAVVQLCATKLIREMYPQLRVGPASKVRTRVVNNTALAKHTEQYGLINRLAVSHAQERQLRKSTAVQGDLFEAYVGGVFVENNYELSSVYGWLKELFTPVVREAYKQELTDHSIISGVPLPAAEETSASKSSIGDLLAGSSQRPVMVNSVFIDDVRLPLSPSTTAPSLASFSTPSLSSSSTPTLASSVTTARSSAYSALRTPSIVSAPPSPYRFPPPRTESGQLSFLNQCLIQRGKEVDWKFDERGGNKTTPLWAVEAWVTNDRGVKECVGKAQAPTKKAAKNEAARQAIAYLKYA